MNKNSFALAIKMLTSNYETGLDLKDKDDKARVSSLFEILESKGFTDQDVNEAVMNMMEKEPSLFGKKLPPLAWFFTYGKQEPDPKEQAILEVMRVIKHVTGYYSGNPVIFDNSTTNACVNGYGGILQIAREVNLRPNRDWLVKNLRDIWIACFNDGVTDNYCRGRTPQRYHHHVKGKFYKDCNGSTLEGVLVEEEMRIDFIGDESKCQELLDSSQKLLEDPKNEKMDKVIAKLEEGLKKRVNSCVI